jgi:hypothetical protein
MTTRKRIIPPTIITERMYKTRSDLHGPEWFRCDLCSHKFKIGETITVIYGGGRTFQDFSGETFGVANPFVCQTCDTGNESEILDKWVQMHREVYAGKYWSFVKGQI